MENDGMTGHGKQGGSTPLKPVQKKRGQGKLVMKEYQIYALVAVLIWSPTYAFSSMALEVFSETVLSMLRVGMAAIFIAFYMAVKKISLPKIKDIPMFLLSASIGFSVYQCLFNQGMSTLTSATGCVLLAISPIFTAVFANVIFGERIRIGGWAAIGICFMGVVILVLWDGTLSINTGVYWMLLVACMAAAYNLCQRKLMRTYSFIQATGYSIIFAGLMLLLFLPESIPQISMAQTRHWIAVLYLGIIPSGAAYLMWGKALSMAEKTSEVTVFMFIQPVFAAVFGFLLMSEIPGMGTYLGTAIIIFGLFLFNAKK